MKISLFAMALAAFAAAHLHGADTDPAATAINSLGIRLLAATSKPKENALLSPYSIQEALAMAYAGADGETRNEMAKALHYPKDDAALNTAFTSLQKELNEIREESAAAEKTNPLNGGKKAEPIILIQANRLFAQSGFEFRKPFLELLRDSYHSPLERVDFAPNPELAKDRINAWVEEQTLKRIPNVIPDNSLSVDTKLVLVNAIYIKAPWAKGFNEDYTKPEPFRVAGGSAKTVPMMKGLDLKLGYARRDGYVALTIPFAKSQLQFLVLLPDKVNGLASLEKKLTPELLATCATLKTVLVDLRIPKFKLEPQVMSLRDSLKTLGMKSAFDRKIANFSRLTAEEGLHIDDVFHKTFLTLDEHGAEAAAAAAVSMVFRDGEAAANILVDHPFLIAIQDCKGGACLFLGRVTDPR